MSQDAFISNMALKLGYSLQLDGDTLVSGIFPSDKIVRLSDFAINIQSNAISLVDKLADTVLVLDDKIKSIPHDAVVTDDVHNIIIDLHTVTKLDIVNEVYKYRGRVVDYPLRKNLYSTEAYVNQGIGSVIEFTPSSLDFYWKRNRDTWVFDAKRMWLLMVKHPVSRSVRNTILNGDDSELVYFLSATPVTSVFNASLWPYFEKYVRYTTAMGYVNDAVRFWVSSFRRGLLDVLHY